MKIQLFSKEKLTSDIVSTELQAQFNRANHEKKAETALLAGRKKGKARTVGAVETKEEKRLRRRAPKPVMSAGIATGRGIGRISAKNARRMRRGRVRALAPEGALISPSGTYGILVLVRLGSFSSPEKGQSDSGSAEVLLDCGASSHMFCDCSFFTDCKPISGHETVAVGDSRHVPIMGRGNRPASRASCWAVTERSSSRKFFTYHSSQQI